MYDFLLFENYHSAYHHNMDVVIIARMLKSQGLKVAIFDIYHEDKADEIDGIPVLHWKSQHQIPDGSWMSQKHSKWETVYKSIQFMRQQHKYMLEVKSFIEDKANNFYCGSYHNSLSTVLFDIQKPCYWWGLRSERFHFTFGKMLSFPAPGFQIIRERRTFLRNKYQRLFVSNDMILDEHVRLGIPLNRMVIREERVIDEMPDSCYDKLNSSFSFLTIGQLRSQKRIEYIIQEFSSIKAPCQYVLAGKSSDEYEKKIESAKEGKGNVIRINKFLDYSDFNELFSQAQFVVFADERIKGTVTNGTMMEALMNMRPIIAPNYNPYKYYIEKYGIGIMYNPEISGDLARVMNLAHQQGCQPYKEKIAKFLNTILFDKVAKKLLEDIHNNEINNA